MRRAKVLARGRITDEKVTEEYLEGMREARSIAWQAVLKGGGARDTAWLMIDERIKELEKKEREG